MVHFKFANEIENKNREITITQLTTIYYEIIMKRILTALMLCIFTVCGLNAAETVSWEVVSRDSGPGQMLTDSQDDGKEPLYFGIENNV